MTSLPASLVWLGVLCRVSIREGVPCEGINGALCALDLLAVFISLLARLGNCVEMARWLCLDASLTHGVR